MGDFGFSFLPATARVFPVVASCIFCICSKLKGDPSVGTPGIAGASPLTPPALATVTVYVPSSAPGLPLVAIMYLPDASVVARAGRPPWGMNSTEAPATGLPSKVTVPDAGYNLGPDCPQPAETAANNPQAVKTQRLCDTRTSFTMHKAFDGWANWRSTGQTARASRANTA